MQAEAAEFNPEGAIAACSSSTWEQGNMPVRQGSGKVALDVGVHDRLEVLEFAVLKQIDDMDLKRKSTRQYESKFVFPRCTLAA